MGYYTGRRLCDCGCGKPVEKWELRNGKKSWIKCLPGHKSKNITYVKPIPNYGYYHQQAWKLFGKDECEICHMTLNTHLEIYNRRLNMHNTLDPKDYSILKNHAWQCVCTSCHFKVEKDQSFRYLEVNEHPDFDLEIENWQ